MRKIKICLVIYLAGFIFCSALDIYPLTRFVYADSPSGLKDAWQCYEKGNELYEQGKYKEAQEEFQRALAFISPQEKNKITEKAGGYDRVGKTDATKETADRDE